MPPNLSSIQARAKAVAPPARQVRRDTVGTDDRGPGTPMQYGVVTDVVINQADASKSVLKWRRVRYKNSPPQAGEIELFGDKLDGYPMPGARFEDYEVWAVGGGTEFKYDVFPYLVMYVAGYATLMSIFKPDGTPLDPNVPDSGCAGSL